jgi:hypothetical protein
MRPIGFSTGALAKGNFALGLEVQRRVGRIHAIELSALRDHELPLIVAALRSLDLTRFSYVSFHAPSRLQNLDERLVFDLLSQLPASWPIVAHPEILRTPSLWAGLGERLCLENMDNRKTTGRTFEELRGLFAQFPRATFCLDVGHARQIDPTMITALLMLREFGGRLRQVHVSDVGPRGEHLPMGALARFAYARISHLVSTECPLIIESVIAPERMEQELDAVSRAFDPS